MAMRAGAVLMASGFSRRFGANKLLERVDGIPMIQRAMAAVPARLFQRALVVSACSEILSLAQAEGYLPLFNPGAAEGQSASIRLGLSELLDMDGVLFSVCDQPWLRRESVERLMEGFCASPDCICALSWQGKRGNPVIFPAAFFPELLALTGDRGGGRVIQAHPERLRLVEVRDGRELQDIDTPENLFKNEIT